MENRTKVLGINKKVVTVVNKIMLIVMLHSALLAPSQNMIVDAYGPTRNKHYSYYGASSHSPEIIRKDNKPSEINNNNQAYIKETNLRKSNKNESNSGTFSIASDVIEGVIGISNSSPLDDAKDNLFKFYIKQMPSKSVKVYLKYDLSGVQDFNGVARSINDNFSTGGYIIKKQLGWTSQTEEININTLKEGENKILFGIVKDAAYQYRVKNVRLEFEAETSADLNSALVVNSPSLLYTKGNELYVKGFLRNFNADTKVSVDSTPLNVVDAEYEGIIKLTETDLKRKFVIIKAYDNKGILGQEIISLDNILEADYLYKPEVTVAKTSVLAQAKTKTNVIAEGASLSINDSALIENKEISIHRLRKVDLAPMSSGLVNVTKGGYGYRFLPDGTKFLKPVEVELAYDENLIPKGHNANEIKTFYFNTHDKTWVAIARDTINKVDKTVTSSTNHFTDYINGIIQTPESPETAGFTPTMMNDIKAADPSSEMTIISPPEVSQKGDANVSYPIKIPAGRKGMQPNIAIQYSNEGGNGWLGKGWNINIPAITIDTRWGSPQFNTQNESEMYSLNGEQLMYPKENNQDWMPNRHREIAGIYNTTPRSRTADVTFTPRKQGSFTKIQRIGNTPDDYFWIVTNTNGTIDFYGGQAQVEANAVIRNANEDIVHWGLFMSIDVFGNCIKYEYENTSIQQQVELNENLNDGRIFHVKNILYNGYLGSGYKYLVQFSNDTSEIREDVTVNARLGVKLIEPYVLDKIIVRKTSEGGLIRKYELKYANGKFNSKLLTTVIELDKNDKIFYSHNFDYYDDISQNGNDVYFTSGVDETICNDIAVPCTDTDNDGICDTNDGCPTAYGSISNNGCPGTGCYNVNFPLTLNNIVYQYTYQFKKSLSNSTCSFKPYRLKNVTVNGNTFSSAGVNNLYLTQFFNGALNNTCIYNQYSLQSTDSAPFTSWLQNNVFNSANNASQAAFYNYSKQQGYWINTNYNKIEFRLSFQSSSIYLNNSISFGIESTSDSGATFQDEAGTSSLLESAPVSGTGVPIIYKINGNVIPGSPYTLPEDLSAFRVQVQQILGSQTQVTVSGLNANITVDNPIVPFTSFTANNIVATDYIIKSCNRSKQKDYSQKKGSSFDHSFTFNSMSLSDDDTECISFNNSDFLVGGVIPSFNSSYSVLGSTANTAEGNSIYIGIGIGCKWYTKSTTFGKQWTWNKDKTKEKTALVDINGDGLDDIVTNDGGFLYYKEHSVIRTYNTNNEPVVTHTFSPKRPIAGITSFFQSNGSTKSKNFQITYGIKKIGGFLGKDTAESESSTNVYFTDGNGDGLIDVVKNGVVYFNHLDNNHYPSFTKNSDVTENMVIKAEAMTVDEPEEEEQTEVDIPAYDIVKVWEAPADGTIKIDNAIELMDTTKQSVATVEMKKNSYEDCFKAIFPVPQVTLNLYHYVQAYTDVLVSPNPVVASNNMQLFNQTCNGNHNTSDYYRSLHRFRFLPGNYEGSVNNGYNSIFLANGSLNGFQNLCNSVLGIDFNLNAKNFIDNTFFSINNTTRIYNSTVNNNTFTYTDSNNNFRISSSFTSDFYSNYIHPGFLQPGANLTNSITFYIAMWDNFYNFYYPNPESEDIFAINNNEYRVGSNIPIQVQSSVPVNISVNGTAIAGNSYDILNNFSLFKSNFENQFAGVNVTLDTSVTPNNVIITSNNPSIQSITLNGTVNNQSSTYPFSSCDDQLKQQVIASQFTWDAVNVKNEKENIELATKKMVAVINESDENLSEIGLREIVDLRDSTDSISNISKIYCYLKKEKTLEWQNLKGDIITDAKIIGKLNKYLPSDLDAKYQEIKDKIRASEIVRRAENKLEAQKWLEQYYKKQQEQNSNQQLVNRTINQNTCVDTTDDLCLLYGVDLNGANSSITNTLTNNCEGQPLRVKKGERIYFRVHSVANGNPSVNWNPKITYTNSLLTGIVDQNNLNPYESSYSDGFILSKNLPTAFPGNSGTTSITWDSFAVNPSDTVVYEIFQRQIAAQEGDDNDVITTPPAIYSQTCPANTTTPVQPTPALANIIMQTISGADAQLTLNDFYFKVTSSSNVNWKQFEWKPKMITSVQSQVTGENGPEGTITNSSTFYPIVDYSIYKSYPCSPKYSLFNTVQVNNGVGLSIKPNIAGIFSSGDNGVLNFVVKSNGNLTGKRTLSINNGAVSFDNNAVIPITTTGQNIEIGYYSDDINLNDLQSSLLSKLALANNSTVRIYYNGTSNTFNVPNTFVNLFQRPNIKFGSMLRQWGQFMYSPKLVTGAISTQYGNLIKEDHLIFSQANADAIQNAINNLPDDNVSAEDAEMELDEFENANNTLMNYNSAFLVASPSKEKDEYGVLQERWTGMHKENYASALSSRAATMEQSLNSYYDEEPYEFQSVLETGAFGINKRNFGKNRNVSGGIAVELTVSVGANASKTLSGNNISTTDYIDFNGDRYPDVVTTKKVQYTSKTGGLNTPTTKQTEVSVSNSKSWGIGAQASYSKGGDSNNVDIGKSRFEGFRGNSGGPISGNLSKGESTSESFWSDINGDGLADMLKKDSSGNLMANLNLGYGQELASYSWNTNNLFASKSVNVSAGTGFSKWNGSAEFGVSLTSAWNNTLNTLVDMNGDGLLDAVYAENNILVNINNGSYFSSVTKHWSGEDLKRESVSVGATANLGATGAYIWIIPSIPPFCLKIPAITLSHTLGSTTTGKTLKSIKDFDGDGYPDILQAVNSNTVKVFYSRIRRTDMLKSVTNPLGGKFTIDYKVQPIDYDNPNAKWAMSDLIIEDGYNKKNDGKDVYKKHFVYEKGRYDRREREFYGYKTVKVEDYIGNTGSNSVLYRTSVSNYLNRSYFLNGLLEDAYVIKGGDVNKKYSRTQNFYTLYKLSATTNNKIDISVTLPATYDVGGTEGRGTAAVLLTQTINELYELSPSPLLTTQVTMQYDDKGRVILYTDNGNVNITSDDYTSEIIYHQSMDAYNIINVPQSIKVTTPSQGVVRERTTEVDPNNGAITRISANNNNVWAETDMEYDQYGNMIHIEYPRNTAQERMSYTYGYETEFYKYVTSITDAFNYTSTALYNSDFDKVEMTTDMSGNDMIYKYDDFGRTTDIIAPKELNSGSEYTIRFEYYPYVDLLPDGSEVTYDPLDPENSTFMPVAVTKHHDQQHPNDDIETYTFIDGLARPIQVKKDISLNKSEDPTKGADYYEALSVSGKTEFDEFGRAVKQFHPWFEGKEDNTKFKINEYDSPFSSETVYDELDRPVKSIDPEGNISLMEYSLGEDIDGIMAIKTKSDVDQNGAQHIITETYKDVAGRVISTNNVGGINGSIWTTFNYNEIGELLSYTDAEDKSTTYTYDMFGRKIRVEHPDNGTTTFLYDNVNLTSLQTANLSNDGTTIDYLYHINRLEHIVYPPDSNGNPNFSNVDYAFGTPGNYPGKLIWQKDATGEQEFSYGNMGEMTTNIRTVVGPNIPTRIFTTNFEYDSWNRLQRMVYPDGERVDYSYDLGGNLNKVTGELNGGAYDYVSRLEYDYYEQRTYLEYGNKTQTFYKYTPKLRRLDNLNVKTSSGQFLMKNVYEYDNVGNITGLYGNGNITDNYMGGSFSHNFNYDELNRLASGGGNFEGSMAQMEYGNDANSNYGFNMSYNDTHGIISKTQTHIKNGNAFMANTYDNHYDYIDGTHKVNKITDFNTGTGQSINYDSNGNIKDHVENDFTKFFMWDESNRLRVVGTKSDGTIQHYIYDAGGERVLKANSDSEDVYQNGTLVNGPGSVSINGYTSYPSAFVVITADGVYSKHYYAGSQRIVSRLGDNDASIFEGPCYKCKNKVDDVKIKQAQKNDLQLYAVKGKLGKISFKDYKPVPLAEQEKELAEENKVAGEERAPQAAPLYFYHPDHLGTSSALTDINGSAYQFFLNLPFGETMAEQKGSMYYNSPYKFNGKELDEETGLYYYGARYYDPKVSIWYSVDPLAEKYPNVNPYVYCLENPINFVDPDGQKPTPYEAAIMAKHVYGDSKIKLVGGWKVSNAGKGIVLNDEITGFKSQVYERTVKGKTEYTYVTAGTEDMLDTKQDVKQIFGLSEQYKQSVEAALKLQDKLGGAEMTYSGHSLGGGLSEANAIATGNNAITFNAAGLSTFSPGGLQKSSTTDAYILTTDPLNAAQSVTGLPRAGGTIHFVSPGSVQGASNGHSIDSMIEGLKTKSMGQYLKNSIDNAFKLE